MSNTVTSMQPSRTFKPEYWTSSKSTLTKDHWCWLMSIGVYAQFSATGVSLNWWEIWPYPKYLPKNLSSSTAGICFLAKRQSTITLFPSLIKRGLNKKVVLCINSVFNSELNIVNKNYSNRFQIIAGPNGSGKTIYMKQIGVIIYLTHCGFLAPAALAEIPLCDRIVVIETHRSVFNK